MAVLVDESIIIKLYNKIKASIKEPTTINLEISGDDTYEDVTYKFSKFLDSNGFTKDLIVCINDTMFYNLRRNYYNNNQDLLYKESLTRDFYNIEQVDGKEVLYKHFIKITCDIGGVPSNVYLGRTFVRVLN